MFQPSDKVAVSMPQLYNNTSVIEEGEIVSVGGDRAVVMLAGEDVPREIPLDRLTSVSNVFGDMTERPNEMPVIDAIRR